MKYLARFLFIGAAIATLLACPGCKAEADIRLGLRAVIGWLLRDLAEPTTYLGLLEQKGSVAQGDYVLRVTQNQLAALRSTLNTGDPVLISAWLDSNMPEIKPLWQKYGRVRLRNFLARLDPRLPGLLEAAGPQVLVYLKTEQLTRSASWAGVAAANERGGPAVSEAQLDALTDILETAWKEGK